MNDLSKLRKRTIFSRGTALGALVLGTVAMLGGKVASAQPAGVPSPVAFADIPAELLPVYQEAARATCNMRWAGLAAIGKVETDHGRSTLPGVRSGASRSGAMGPMQFLGRTWAVYGVDGDNDGIANVHGAVDAIWGAANYLCSSGAGQPDRLGAAIWAYNHSDSYVAHVLGLAVGYEAGAHEINGDIRAKWAALGWERSALGYPVSSVATTPDGAGRYNHFQGGSIYWSPATGAQQISGAIRDRWSALGWERSVMGYPLTDEQATPDGAGRYNHFQGGSIFWSPATGAQEINGDIRAKWAALGWERSALGYPSSGVGTTADGVARYSRFTGGSIYWSPATGAHELQGPIEQRYRQEGGSQSAIGLPVNGIIAVPAGLRSDFAGGVIAWDRATGETSVVLE
ncbi:MAG: lytic murein transglycosylase [Acidimicrobiales bacterium]